MLKSKRPATYIEDIKAFRQSFAATLTKFENPSTRRSTLDEVKEVIFNQVQDPERVSLVVKMALELNEHQQTSAKKEYIKLLGLLAEVLKDRLLEHIPKLLACIVKKLKESDALLNDTIAESVGSIFENVVSTLDLDQALQQCILITRTFFQLGSSGSKNTQIGAALSISKILQCCPPEVINEFADEIIPKIFEMLSSSACKAQLQYFECILSLMLALEDNREKVVEVVQNFQPLVVAGMQNEDWNVRKIAVDTTYYCVEKDLLEGPKDELMKNLNNLRTDKIKNVRDIAATTLQAFKEKYGERKSHDSDSPNPDSRKGSPNRKSSPERKPLTKNPNFFKGMKKDGPPVEIYTVLSPKRPEIKSNEDSAPKNNRPVTSPEFVIKEQPRVFDSGDYDRVSFGIPKPDNVKTQHKSNMDAGEEQLQSMRSQEERRFSPPHVSSFVNEPKKEHPPNKTPKKKPADKPERNSNDSGTIPTDYSDTSGCFASIFLQLKKLSKQQLKLAQSFSEHQEFTLKEMNGLKDKVVKIEEYLRSYPPQPQILYHPPYGMYNPQQQQPQLLQQAIITQPHQQIYQPQQQQIYQQQQPIYQQPQQQPVFQQQNFVKPSPTVPQNPQTLNLKPQIQNISPIPSVQQAYGNSRSGSQSQLNQFLQNQMLNTQSSASLVSNISVKDEGHSTQKKKPNKPLNIDTSKSKNKEPVTIVPVDQNDGVMVVIITSDGMEFATDLVSYVFSNQGVECELTQVEDPIMASNVKCVFMILDALGPQKTIINQKYSQYLAEYGNMLKVIYLLEESLTESDVKEILATCTGDHIGLRYAVANEFDDSSASIKKSFIDDQEATNLIDFLTQFC